MVSLASLWLPIVVSAVIVFLASCIIHMFLPFHRSDFEKLPQEDQVLDTLRSLNIPSGQYGSPHAIPPRDEAAGIPGKAQAGTRAFPHLAPGADPGWEIPLLQWFIYLLVISLFAAYLAHIVIAAGAPYPAVFRFICVAALMAYSLGHAHQSIWYRQRWRKTVNYFIDGLMMRVTSGSSAGFGRANSRPQWRVAPYWRTKSPLHSPVESVGRPTTLRNDHAQIRLRCVNALTRRPQRLRHIARHDGASPAADSPALDRVYFHPPAAKYEEIARPHVQQGRLWLYGSRQDRHRHQPS